MIGCGRIASKHLDALVALNSSFQLCALVDVKADAMRQALLHPACQQQPPATYPSLAELIAKESFDLGIICTPSGLHAAHAIQLAQAGKHILCEKPMATSLTDAKAMIAAANQHQVRLYVVKQNRLNPPIVHLKQALHQQRLGKIYLVTANVFWQRPQAYYDQAAWRGTWRLDGGALMNQASHYMDLLYWLFGPVHSIHCFSATQARQIEAEDTAVVNLAWRNGTLGALNVTMLTYPQNLEGSLTVLGECGTVKIGGVALNEIHHWEFAATAPHDHDIHHANYTTTTVYGFGHTAYYQAMLDHLRHQSSAVVLGEEAYHSLELIIGAYQAAASQQVVQLPLEDTKYL